MPTFGLSTLYIGLGPLDVESCANAAIAKQQETSKAAPTILPWVAKVVLITKKSPFAVRRTGGYYTSSPRSHSVKEFITRPPRPPAPALASPRFMLVLEPKDSFSSRLPSVIFFNTSGGTQQVMRLLIYGTPARHSGVFSGTITVICLSGANP